MVFRSLTTIRILFSRGGKIRGRKISRNSMRSGYLFRGRKISRKIQIREYSENFLHAKNTCCTVHAWARGYKYLAIVQIDVHHQQCPLYNWHMGHYFIKVTFAITKV